MRDPPASWWQGKLLPKPQARDVHKRSIAEVHPLVEGEVRGGKTRKNPKSRAKALETGPAVVSQKEGQEEGGLATPFFVYSSNVDGHFDRAGFDSASSVLELHGDARRWFCPACAAGADVPFSCASQTPMEGFRFSVDEASMTLPGGERDGRRRREEQQEDGGSAFDFGDSSGGWPRCRAPQCPSPALPARPSLLRPAVHMFDERDDALLAHLRSEEERYVAWECRPRSGRASRA